MESTLSLIKTAGLAAVIQQNAVMIVFHIRGSLSIVSDDEVILQATKVEQRGYCGESGEFNKSGEWVLGKFKYRKRQSICCFKENSIIPIWDFIKFFGRVSLIG